VTRTRDLARGAASRTLGRDPIHTPQTPASAMGAGPRLGDYDCHEPFTAPPRSRQRHPRRADPPPPQPAPL